MQQQVGERSKKYESSLQTPRSGQEKSRRCSMCKATAPCSPTEAHGELAVLLQLMSTTQSRSPCAATEEHTVQQWLWPRGVQRSWKVPSGADLGWGRMKERQRRSVMSWLLPMLLIPLSHLRGGRRIEVEFQPGKRQRKQSVFILLILSRSRCPAIFSVVNK